jgi:hypothetical protein
LGLFGRRKETLNERLLREAGLAPDGSELEQPSAPPSFDLLGSRFLDADSRATTPRMREWDAVVTVDAPELEGDEVTFTAIDSENLLVDDEVGDANLTRLAEAVEAQLAPPYRARGVRRSGTLWAVSATRIQIARFRAEGDTVDLAVHDGERTATLDGEPTTRGFPELERLGEEQGADYAIHAERLDGDAWEVKVSRL